MKGGVNMKRLNTAVIFVVVLCAVPTAARAQASYEEKEREIVATGVGQIEADPERASRYYYSRLREDGRRSR